MNRTSLFIIYGCLLLVGCNTTPKKNIEFKPFIVDAQYSARSGPVEIKKGSPEKIDYQLTRDGYARIGFAKVRQVVRTCTSSIGGKQCTEVDQASDPTSSLFSLVSESGGDLVIMVDDKQQEFDYEQGSKCTNWGESSRYETRTNWSTRTKTTYLVTNRVCTYYEDYHSMDEMVVSSAVVWRKDAQLAQQQALNIELTAGILSGDTKQVKSAIESGANINITDMYGNHPLSRAAYHGYHEIVRYLIDKGADINGRGIRPPPLFQAAENGHYEIFQLLIDRGAKINYKDSESQQTLLHLAAKGGKVRIVQYLLDRGAEADQPDKNGLTPLMFAAMSGSEEVAQMLIQHKAEVNRKSKLLNGLVANWAPVHFAAFKGDAETMKVLLANGADAELEDYRKQSPSHLAKTFLMLASLELDSAKETGESPSITAIRQKTVRIRQAVVETLDLFMNGRYGFVDRSGSWVIPPRFHELGSFSEGLAKAKHSNGWGYIDKTGKWAIKPQFASAGNFSEGAAVVTNDSDGEEKAGFIDKTGRFITPNRFISADWFEEGLAPVTVRLKGEKMKGYIDKRGQFVINPKFRGATPFSQGLAAVTVNDKKWGFIDKTGKFVINPAFGFEGLWKVPQPFNEGLSAVNLKDELYGYIDRSGKTVIPARFRETFRFSEGLAAAFERRWIFIDKTGKQAFDNDFYKVSLMGGFSEGLCAVEVNKGEWAFIDKTGGFISNMRFSNAKAFKDGVAWVQVKDRWGLIDKNSKLIIEPKYADTFPFHDGVAVARVKGKEMLEIHEMGI
jgi:ankyrin repeat protein